MKRRDDGRFAMPFAEIWQHSPFHPGARVSRFLDEFVEAGRFDADRFWEFVTGAGISRPRSPGGFAAAERARIEKRRADS